MPTNTPDTKIESVVRQTLARIDELRRFARRAEDMAGRWLTGDGDLVIERDVVVKRRWRASKVVHTEYVLNEHEREAFVGWVTMRGREATIEADALAATIADERP